MVFPPETPSRCRRSSSGSATWPSRSTAASCSSSPSSRDWTSPAVGFLNKDGHLCVHEGSRAAFAARASLKMWPFSFITLSCYLLEISSPRSDWRTFPLVSLFFQMLQVIFLGPAWSPTATRSSMRVILELGPDTRWTFCSSTPSCLLLWCSARSATRSETGLCVTEAVGQPSL